MVLNYAMDSNAGCRETAPTMHEPALLPPSLAIPAAASGALGEAAFVAWTGSIVEHSPWVARRAWRQGPFASWAEVFQAMAACIQGASREEQVALLRVHPELAGREAVAGTMTPDSSAEQGRLGLTALDAPAMARLLDLNRRYRERFG
ncbi:MAG: 2-oxo-4-hydroxy-4-carboxy-5-ureidoimidazoline decarboxylase, partial [Comamonadaceae bacterium]